MGRSNYTQDAMAAASQRRAASKNLDETVFKGCVAAHVSGLDGIILFYPNIKEKEQITELAYVANVKALLASGTPDNNMNAENLTQVAGSIQDAQLSRGITEDGIVTINYRGRNYYGIALNPEAKTGIADYSTVNDRLWKYEEDGELSIPHIAELKPLERGAIAIELLGIIARQGRFHNA